jgi:hypothetical protein
VNLRVLAILLAVPLAMHVYSSTQARFIADDYCWPMWIDEGGGFWAFQRHWYETFTGRWATTLVISVRSLFGPTATPYLALGMLATWFGASYWCAYELSKRRLFAFVVGEAIVAGSMLGAPSAFESVFWPSGATSYLMPFIIVAGALALALRTDSPVVAGLGSFIAAGFNEPFMLIQVAALGLAFACLPSRRQLIRGALIGALVGTLAVVLAPGALARHAENVVPGIVERLVLGLRSAGASLILASFGGLLAFSVGRALSGEVNVAVPRKTLLLALPASLLAAVFPSALGLGEVYGRTVFAGIVPFVLVALLLGLGVQRPATGPIVVALAILATISAVGLVAMPLHAYARDWDLVHEQLLEARGEPMVEIDSLSEHYPGMWHIREDPAWVVNRCAAVIYGVGTVRTKGRRRRR